MSDALNLPREVFEPVMTESSEMPSILGSEFTLCFQALSGLCEIRTCYGDICKIVNALMDYSRLLEMTCEAWDLHGFHRATYEYHAEKLRQIAEKYSAGIGYNYEETMERCRKKRAKKKQEDDVGEDAMLLAVRKSQQTQAKKATAGEQAPAWVDDEPPELDETE